MVPAVGPVALKSTVNSPIAAPPLAESSTRSVQLFDEPAPGTVGVNSSVILSALPSGSKYSIGMLKGAPVPPASVAWAGRLAAKVISVVGLPTKLMPVMLTVSRFWKLSRAGLAVTVVPSGLRAHPCR
jgi:hypothetical protein